MTGLAGAAGAGVVLTLGRFFGRRWGWHLGSCFGWRFHCCLGDGRFGFDSDRGLGNGFGLGRGLGRLLGLLSGHGQPQITKRDKETDTVSAKYIPAQAWVKSQINASDER